MPEATPKELLMQEMEAASEPVLLEVLDFLRFLKNKAMEDEVDITDARTALKEVEQEGTVSWEDLKTEVDL